jgi:hypothetical protein
MSETDTHPANQREPEAGEPPAAASAPPPASIADGSLRKLDPRHLVLRRIAGWIVTAAFSAVLFIAVPIVAFSAKVPLWGAGLMLLGWGASTGIVALLGQYWPIVEHRATSYLVNEIGIEIHRGVVWRRIINVSRSRIQHTDVSQGPLERRFGLGTLVIHTAGTDHSRVDLSGLDHGAALAIRDHLVLGGEDDAV